MGSGSGAERLQKLLARAGVASRRHAEEMIVAGKVRVNGKRITELGAKATRRDKIEVDGKRIVLEDFEYYILHKPRGVMTTLRDPQGRPTVRSIMTEVTARVYPVGRLDFHTSGALLLTNDGDFTEALLHPRTSVPKIYIAKLRGHLDEAALQSIQDGLRLDEGVRAKPAEIVVMREEERCSWVQITLYEGKNRQIHRMGEAIGHEVLRLARLSFAGINTDDLRPGDYRPLTAKELEKLKKKYMPGATPTR